MSIESRTETLLHIPDALKARLADGEADDDAIVRMNTVHGKIMGKEFGWVHKIRR